MSQNDFKKKQFEEALQVTKKIKTNMKPFLERVSKSQKKIADISAIWQAIQILYSNLTKPQVPPLLKMNSMFGVKCIIDTCDYICHSLIQAYIFPIIKRGAFTDIDHKDEDRGVNIFTGPDQVKSYGYNYVKLCTEMVKALGLMKPARLFYNQPTKDKSEYMFASNHLTKNLLQKQVKFVFFKELNQTPDKLNKLYSKKVSEFNNQPEDYSKFIQQKFTQQIKANFEGQTLDIRQLIKCGDCYVSQDILEIVGDIFEKAKSCNLLRQAIDVVNCFVLSGDSHARLFLHDNLSIKNLVKAVINIQSPSKNVDRGQNFMPEKKGTPQDRKQLYCDFLKCLELWANSFPKNSFKTNSGPSKIYKYYKILKQDFKFQFPGSALIAKAVKQSQQNFKKKQDFNRILRQQVTSEQFAQQLDDSIISAKRTAELPLSSKHSIQLNNPSKPLADPVSSNLLKPQAIPSSKSLNQSHVTPMPKQNEGEKFLQRINKAQNILNSVTQSQKELPKKMELLQKQMEQMEKALETLNVPQDEFDNIMGKFYEVDQKLKRIQPSYEQYRKSKIDFPKFCSKVNSKPGSSRIVTDQKLPESNLIIQQPKKQQQIIKVQKSQKILPPQQQIVSQSKLPLKIPGQASLNSNYDSKSPSPGPQSNRSIPKSTDENKGKEVGFILSENNFASKIQKYEAPPQQKQAFSKKNIYANQAIPVVNVIPSETKLGKQNNYRQQKIERAEYAVKQLAPQQKVEFDRSQMGESRYTNTINAPQNQSRYQQYCPTPQIVTYESRQPNLINIVGKDEIYPEPQNRQKTFNRKFNDAIYGPPRHQLSAVVDYKPITTSKQENIMSNQHMLSPIKNQDLRIDDAQDVVCINDDQYIQGPSLNPLDCSYHDFQELTQKQHIKHKNFKDVFTNNMFIQTNKRQNLFKLQTESSSLIKPTISAYKKSRVDSKVSIPQLLEERSKKYEVQMRLMEQNKNMKIKELQNKLIKVQRQKTTISNQLKDRQLEIRTMRQNSQVDMARSRTDQYNLIDDQNYLMKKIATSNAAHSMAHLPKKLMESKINNSRILAQGQLINTKVYKPYFQNFKNEKQKKVHMKNKQLLFKDKELEIGYMGHLEGNQYKITVFITPQFDFILDDMTVDFDQNLNIQYERKSQLKILSGRQYRQQFLISIVQFPYVIPHAHLAYKINNNAKKTSFVLPCSFHKFFTIRPVNQSTLIQQFQKQKIIRGQQIPYSKRILKNIDLIRDFLPHIEKLNNGQPNEVGEMSFGGQATFRKLRFLIKLSVKPNQFLYIQVVDKKYNSEERKIIDFYVATVNHFLMKQISWQQLTSEMGMSATK